MDIYSYFCDHMIKFDRVAHRNVLKYASIITFYATFTVIESNILCNSFLSGKKMLIIYVIWKLAEVTYSSTNL